MFSLSHAPDLQQLSTFCNNVYRIINAFVNFPCHQTLGTTRKRREPPWQVYASALLREMIDLHWRSCVQSARPALCAIYVNTGNGFAQKESGFSSNRERKRGKESAAAATRFASPKRRGSLGFEVSRLLLSLSVFFFFLAVSHFLFPRVLCFALANFIVF